MGRSHANRAPPPTQREGKEQREGQHPCQSTSKKTTPLGIVFVAGGGEKERNPEEEEDKNETNETVHGPTL